jgi:hypothetical protein
MDPNQVRFTQSSVRFRFSDGTSIDDLAEALKAGEVRADEVPPLRVFEKDGLYFTLDNRRLEAFRRAGMAIPFRLATAEEINEETWKFTTKNAGVSVRVRGVKS